MGFTYRQLIHGHIDHGMNFLPPPAARRSSANPKKDLSRLATTYYHREGPAGRVMEKFNWFPDSAELEHLLRRHAHAGLRWSAICAWTWAPARCR